MDDIRTKFIPVVGQTFGRWTVVSSEVKRGSAVGSGDIRSAHWLVQCECGLTSWRNAARLLQGNTNACKSCCRNSAGEHGKILNFLRKTKYNAKGRGISFSEEIDSVFIENLYEKQGRLCAISGVPISFLDKWKDKKGFTCSLDRKDSSKPYLPDNVHLVHKVVNMMKWTLSLEDFMEWNRIISEHNRLVK